MFKKILIKLCYLLMAIVLLQNSAFCAKDIDTIKMIDKLYQSRLIDIDTACLYKIYAVVNPGRLPEDLRSTKDTSSISATYIVKSVQDQFDLLKADTRKMIQELLIIDPYPDVLIDSDIYPIRVHCPSDLDIEMGYITLKYTEITWEVELYDFGFYQPPSDGDFGGNDYYDVFLRVIPYGGYMSSLSRDYSVDWYSKASYIVINSMSVSDTSGYGELIAHEFNHSCQYALDPAEVLNEATSEYISEMVFNEFFHHCNSVPYFQYYPYYSIDYRSYDIDDIDFMYHYGGALFLGFLAEYYDNGNPVFIRRLWEESRQATWDNEPDMLDTIESFVDEISGHTFRDMYREFAIWRYMTGENDDGEHFSYGSQMGEDYNVQIEKTVNPYDLPLAEFKSDNPPAEFGANYIEFLLEGWSGNLLLQFSGNPFKAWSADVILVKGDGSPTEYVEVVQMGNFEGSAIIAGIGNYEKAVLVISNLSDGDHDPENQDWDYSNYKLNAELIGGDPFASVFTNQDAYLTGDELDAQIFIANPGEEIDVDVVVALAAGDKFYFYPNWTPVYDETRLTLEANSSQTKNILTDITIGKGLSGEFTFYTLLFNTETDEIIGNRIEETDFRIYDGWKLKLGDSIISTPTIGEDRTIYIGSRDNCLNAINPDGTLLWKFETGMWVDGKPCIGDDGTIYVGSRDYYLYAVNPDGSLKWSFQTGNEVFSSPTIGEDGTIYVGSVDGYFYALNPDGTLKWNYSADDSIWSSPCFGLDGTIYFGSQDYNLYALNQDGTLKWKYATDYIIWGSPRIDENGTIYIGSCDKYLHAVNPDGSVKWKFLTENTVYSAPAIGNDKSVYFGSYDGYFYSLNSDGTLQWKIKAKDGIDNNPIIDDRGYIYTGDWEGMFYAINPDGTIIWDFETGDMIGSSSAIGDNGMIYFGSWDNYFYALALD